MTMNREMKWLVSVSLAAGYALVVSTGTLTLVLVILAAAGDLSVVDMAHDVFPRVRSGAPPARMPALGYALFGMYIVGASVIAALMRRRIARKLR
jgi:hypothetical protein